VPYRRDRVLLRAAVVGAGGCGFRTALAQRTVRRRNVTLEATALWPSTLCCRAKALPWTRGVMLSGQGRRDRPDGAPSSTLSALDDAKNIPIARAAAGQTYLFLR
jgi:hypothetical protein